MPSQPPKVPISYMGKLHGVPELPPHADKYHLAYVQRNISLSLPTRNGPSSPDSASSRKPHPGPGSVFSRELCDLDELCVQSAAWAAGTAALFTFGIFSLIHHDLARSNALCLGQSQG